MARRSSSSELSVSLFPFLAVLVCVMGALIFLLLATTKRMYDVAVAEAEAERIASLATNILSPSPDVLSPSDIPAIEIPPAVLGDPVALEPVQTVPNDGPSAQEIEFEQRRRQLEQEWRGKLAQLTQRRDQLRAAWKRQQTLHKAEAAKVTELEVAVGKTETRLRGVLAEVKTLQEDQSADEDLAELEQAIIDLRQKLRRLQNRPTEGNTKFAVIPFDTRSGTMRRPILIECTDQGLRFLPEDIMIKPSDLIGFSERINPLAAGASALVNHWTAWNRKQKSPELEPEPYVLLIVRPSGTVAYYVAMKMLSSLKTPFGYELVDDAVELQPLPVDPLAREACVEAVGKLIAERADVMHQVHDGFRTGGGTGKGGLPRPSAKDTFDVSDVVPSANSVGERSWENVERFEGRKVSGPPAEPKPRSLSRSAPPPSAGSGGDGPSRRANSATAAGRNSSPAPATSPTARRESADAEASGETVDSMKRPAPSTARQSQGKRPARGTDAAGEVRLEQLARRHWGDSKPGATIGIEQNVTVKIDGQQILVADGRSIRYQPDELPLHVFLKVMDAIDQESQTWGNPREGFYWTPRLQFVISPGGNQMFERIDPLTIRSGLAATKEFTLDGVQPAAQEIAP